MQEVLNLSLILGSDMMSSVRSLAAACRLRPRFLCINDDIEQPGKGGMASFACRQFLKRLFHGNPDLKKVITDAVDTEPAPLKRHFKNMFPGNHLVF